MNRIYSLFALSLILLVFSSCKKEDEPGTSSDGLVTVSLSLTDGSQQVYEGETINLQNDYDLKIALFRTFISNVEFQNTNGVWKPFEDVVILDPGTINSTDNSFSAKLEAGSYQTLRFGLGVDSAMNEEDPSKMSNDDPLSTYQAMYWTMLKYRFAKFEGMANTTGQLGSSSDILLTYHPGTNPLYHMKDLPVSFNLQADGNHTVELELNINEMLAGNNAFDFTVENSTHSATPEQIALAAKFMDNLRASIHVK